LHHCNYNSQQLLIMDFKGLATLYEEFKKNFEQGALDKCKDQLEKLKVHNLHKMYIR
jgi:hypothetical protein